MSAIRSFPDSIQRYLRQYVARTRRLRLARTLLMAGMLLTGWTVAVAYLDRLVGLAGWLRLLLLVLESAALVFLVAPPLRNLLWGPIDWVHASESVEATVGVFGQRLTTVTSQLLASPAHRGSQQMLEHLVDDVSREIQHADAPPVRWRSLIRPASLALIFFAAALLLTLVPWLNLPRLVARQWMPLASIAPVTTTRIDVSPGSTDVPEREPVTIQARVQQLRGSAPTLWFSTNNQTWDEAQMTAISEDVYTFTFPHPDRDLHYYVTAGDGRTPTHTLRVLRRPAIADFRIRYTYPAYTGRSPLSTHNSDGLIEAPQGSDAVLSIVSTEPLKSAFLILGAVRREMSATNEPNVRQIQLSILKDQPYELELTSDRGVISKGPANLLIRAVPDRAPLVRLLQPATDLRLSPREIIPLAYQALDDYGVASLGAHVQVNAKDQTDFALRMRGGDRRRLEGTFDLDLAQFNLKVGDVVTVEVYATDKAGQKTSSDVRHVLISPRSVDVATHQRLNELATAAEYAMTWAEQLARAQKFLEQSRKATESEQAASLARVGRQIAAANETALLLRQTLLRAIMYSNSPRTADLLATWVDGVTLGLDNADRVDESLAANHKIDDAAAGRLSRLVNNSREMANQVRQLSEGEQAGMVQADRANLKISLVPATAPVDRAALERRRLTLERVRQENAAALAAIGINAKDPAVDALVQQRVDVATRLIGSAKPVDFVAAAQRWSSAIKSKEQQPPHLEERLVAAAQAEAVRPDAELVAARDLQVAARAAAVFTQPIESIQDAKQKARAKEGLDQFASALAALRAEHDINRRMMRAKTPQEARDIQAGAWPVREAASAARGKMIAWAANPNTSPDELASKIREAEDLAMAANAYTFAREFDKASEADRKLAAALGKPDLANASENPRTIHQLAQAQEKITDSDQADATAQERVATQISAARAASMTGNDAIDSRQKTTEAIGIAQERLASMPLQLTAAREAALFLGEISARLADAKAKASDASGDEREITARMVTMVSGERADAKKAFDAAARAVSPRVTDELVESLKPFAPDTTTAVSAIDDQLRSALAAYEKALTDAVQSEDSEVIEQAAEVARQAIQQAQESLREAQARVIERDPLVSARWFAQAAAQAMSGDSPNPAQAALHQRATLEALTRAGIDAVRRSKNARLSQVPSFAQFYLPPLAPWTEGEQRHAGDRLYQALPGLREWGRLRERLGESVSAPVRETDPPGYSDALKTYFEVLSKEDAKSQEPKK